nr:AsmA family protein [Raoultella sp. NCTC 9187]
MSQLPQRQVNLSLNGRGVPLSVLQAWGWPALPVTGDGNFQLTASGSVLADAPLRPTVNGQLSATNMEKQQVCAGDAASGEVSGGPARACRALISSSSSLLPAGRRPRYFPPPKPVAILRLFVPISRNCSFQIAELL